MLVPNDVCRHRVRTSTASGDGRQQSQNHGHPSEPTRNTAHRRVGSARAPLVHFILLRDLQQCSSPADISEPLRALPSHGTMYVVGAATPRLPRHARIVLPLRLPDRCTRFVHVLGQREFPVTKSLIMLSVMDKQACRRHRMRSKHAAGIQRQRDVLRLVVEISKVTRRPGPRSAGPRDREDPDQLSTSAERRKKRRSPTDDDSSLRLSRVFFCTAMAANRLRAYAIP